jgi:hypothetical protein
LKFHRADIDHGAVAVHVVVAVCDAWETPLVAGRRVGAVSGVDRGAAELRHHGRRRPAIVTGRTEHRVDRFGGRADLVACRREARATGAVANQIVAKAREMSVYVGMHRSRIAGNNGVE